MTEINSTVLGNETSFKGTMKFKDSLKIDGFFEGNIESSGSLYVECATAVKFSGILKPLF
jgi:cytoskeletal protein CcmA (bactofilin family)